MEDKRCKPHDFWRARGSHSEDAPKTMVDAILVTIDETVDVAEKKEKWRYLGWR